MERIKFIVFLLAIDKITKDEDIIKEASIKYNTIITKHDLDVLRASIDEDFEFESRKMLKHFLADSWKV